ncbi:MAG: hypothetical protein B7Z66_03885 [Chromatiales bacterium 21-64-14]|nr:MAG: hypothetical protein B7Z66_03885 [Chromatiales bacterium 21-64-14]HQU14780.1 DUF2970 domain-containing protein [Gammaproteobacteria bacterium]
MSNPRPERVSLLQVLQSVLAAMFGVQSERNRKRDFNSGTPSQYIIIGLIVVALFVLTIFGVVELVLRFAGT